jgi:hypothetical protein
MSSIIDPTRIYEVQGQRYELQTATLVGAIANNQSVIAGVTGYTHIIMGWDIYAFAGGVSDMDFKNGSGGTVMAQVTLPASGRSLLPVGNSNYFKLTISTGLFMDMNTTQSNVNIFYLTIK